MSKVYVVVERLEPRIKYNGENCYIAPVHFTDEVARGVFETETDAKNRIYEYLKSLKKDIRITDREDGISFIALEDIANDIFDYHTLLIRCVDENKMVKIMDDNGEFIDIKLKKLKEVH